MTVKIISNGKVNDTRIIDLASGMELQASCTRAEIVIDADKAQPTVILHFTDVKLEVVAEVVKTFPPTGLALDDVKGG